MYFFNQVTTVVHSFKEACQLLDIEWFKTRYQSPVENRLRMQLVRAFKKGAKPVVAMNCNTGMCILVQRPGDVKEQNSSLLDTTPTVSEFLTTERL